MRFGRSAWRIGAMIFLLMILTFSSCMKSPEAKSAQYLEKGKQLLQQKDVPRAILQFKNAGQATPKNAEVFYQLGLAYMAAGDLRSGVASLRKAIALNPKHAGAQLKMAELMASTNDAGVLKDAQERLQELLQESPDNPDALHALGLTELKLNQPENGVEHLNRAMMSGTQDLMIAVTLAQAKLSQKDAKGAEDVLKQACASSSKSADALVILGGFYAAQNRPVDAEQQFQRALALDPNSIAALSNLAMLQYLAGRKQDAEQNFKRLADSAEKSLKSVHALFLFQEGRRDEAIREFEKLTKGDPENRLVRTQLVIAYRTANRKQDAQNVLAAALKKNPKDLDALLQRAEMYLDDRQYGPAEADFNQVLRQKPEAPEIHYAVARLQQVRGAMLTYRQELSEALQLNPYLLPVRLELSQSLLSSSNAKAALDLLNSAPESQRGSLPVLIQRNWAYWALGNMTAMRHGIDQGLALAETSDLLLQDGMWKLRAGDPAKARGTLTQILNANPSDVRALQALNQSYAVEHRPSAALQKVTEYASKAPNVARVQHFLGVLFMTNGNQAEARKAFNAAKAADPQFVPADLGLVQADVLAGKFDDARKRLASMIAADNRIAEAHLWLGVLEEGQHNHAVAMEEFRKVVELDNGNAQALNNLATLLAEYGNKPDEALKYAERAVELDPEKPDYCDTLGWILYRKALYPGAIGYLERAAAKRHAIAQYHLAMAYAQSGNPTRGRAALKVALALNPGLPEAKLATDLLGSVQ